MSATAPPIAGQSAVELHDVTKIFGSVAALRGVTATFPRGHLFIILGENGAGKSTLLRVIAGLSRPTRGRLVVLGSEKVGDAAPQLGYMPHAALLYDDLNGIENLRYFARLYGLRDDTRCLAALEAVGLDAALERRTGQYSQGMRQRLSLARAIVHDPALLLLDEPFSNLDAAGSRHMVALLAAMRDGGKTVLVVTHHPALLAEVADESLMLAAGRLLERASGAAEPGGVARERFTVHVRWQGGEA